MKMTEEQFNLLMLDYLEGTASRNQRMELMSALAESDELCSLFNNIMALERMAAEAVKEDDDDIAGDGELPTAAEQQRK